MRKSGDEFNHIKLCILKYEIIVNHQFFGHSTCDAVSALWTIKCDRRHIVFYLKQVKKEYS
jgi:hypothetical protein